MEKDKEQESFTFTDKRRFVVDDAGSVTPEGKPKAEETSQPFESTGEEEKPPKEAGKTPADDEDHIPFPALDFPTFILSLSSSALFHLGLMENPQTGKVERNLNLAKQTIDIIAMLHEKTKGNLSHDEENLTENLLTDLRLKYVNEISKK